MSGVTELWGFLSLPVSSGSKDLGMLLRVLRVRELSPRVKVQRFPTGKGLRFPTDTAAAWGPEPEPPVKLKLPRPGTWSIMASLGRGCWSCQRPPSLDWNCTRCHSSSLGATVSPAWMLSMKPWEHHSLRCHHNESSCSGASPQFQLATGLTIPWESWKCTLQLGPKPT